MKYRIGPFAISITEVPGESIKEDGYRLTITDTRTKARRTSYTETFSGAMTNVVMYLDSVTTDNDTDYKTFVPMISLTNLLK